MTVDSHLGIIDSHEDSINLAILQSIVKLVVEVAVDSAITLNLHVHDYRSSCGSCSRQHSGQIHGYDFRLR